MMTEFFEREETRSGDLEYDKILIRAYTHIWKPAHPLEI